METNKEDIKRFINAKNKVRKIKIFYIHLVIYIVMVGVVLYSLLSIEKKEYANTVMWVNLSSITLWTIFIVLHAWSVFKGGLIFKKSWEERKVEKFLKEEGEEQTTIWE